MHHRPDCGLIEVLDVSTDRIHHELTANGVDKLLGMFEQNVLQASDAFKSDVTWENAGSIDRIAGVAITPPPDCIKILHSKTDWVHTGMTPCARCIGPVRNHRLAHRKDLTRFLTLRFESGNISWRRRRRSGKKIFQYPFATQHRRGPRGVRSDCQNTALAQ